MIVVRDICIPALIEGEVVGAVEADDALCLRSGLCDGSAQGYVLRYGDTETH